MCAERSSWPSGRHGKTARSGPMARSSITCTRSGGWSSAACTRRRRWRKYRTVRGCSSARTACRARCTARLSRKTVRFMTRPVRLCRKSIGLPTRRAARADWSSFSAAPDTRRWWASRAGAGSRSCWTERSRQEPLPRRRRTQTDRSPLLRRPPSTGQFGIFLSV